MPAAGPVSLSTPSRTENHVSQSPLHRDNPYGTRTGESNGPGCGDGEGRHIEKCSVLNNLTEPYNVRYIFRQNGATHLGGTM